MRIRDDERLLVIARELANETAGFAETKGPGMGDHATSKFLAELRRRAAEEFGSRCKFEVKGSPVAKSAIDFHFPKDKTLVELALSLNAPNSEFHKDIFKAILAKDHGMVVKRLVLIAKHKAELRHAEPASKAIIDWVRRTQHIEVIVRDILPPDHVPTVFRFAIGGFGPGSTLEWRDGHLHHEVLPFEGARGRASKIITPTRGQWQSFWRAVERIGAWQWEPEYVTPVLDGTCWELNLGYHDRAVESSGSNGYPGGDGAFYSARSDFGRFLSALRRLTGKTFR